MSRRFNKPGSFVTRPTTWPSELVSTSAWQSASQTTRHVHTQAQRGRQAASYRQLVHVLICECLHYRQQQRKRRRGRSARLTAKTPKNGKPLSSQRPSMRTQKFTCSRRRNCENTTTRMIVLETETNTEHSSQLTSVRMQLLTQRHYWLQSTSACTTWYNIVFT